MTKQEMIQILIDKGFAPEWAKVKVKTDHYDLHHIQPHWMREECSICRRTMSSLEMLYHYHPCE